MTLQYWTPWNYWIQLHFVVFISATIILSFSVENVNLFLHAHILTVVLWVWNKRQKVQHSINKPAITFMTSLGYLLTLQIPNNFYTCTVFFKLPLSDKILFKHIIVLKKISLTLILPPKGNGLNKDVKWQTFIQIRSIVNIHIKGLYN